jgi:taurine--2-oxoglutarate transaminase
MFWGVELVKNRTAKSPFNTFSDKVSGKPLLVDRVAARMMSQGVYVQSWMSHFVIAPPLIITKSEIDHGVAVFDEALSIADQEAEA